MLFGLRILAVCLICLNFVCATQSDEFTVVVYNLENLFDVDGVAIYDDYTQDEPEDPFTYSRLKLLTKIQNATAVLQAINGGAGPEVILFQELEADFTPESAVEDLNVFLSHHLEATVQEMLTDQWRAEYAGLPSQAWLLKAMSDAGQSGYTVAVAPSKGRDAGLAHSNAVFSKFPIVSVELHALERARDIMEVELDVAGAPLYLYVNHWKSGASSPVREPIRVQNAKVLRALIDARLEENPYADIIIGGDLNSHYNHSLLNPDIDTGINQVLGSQGDELGIRALGGPDLYNLWFELPPEQRYSEVWRGRRGTLMHLMLTRGLYDVSGIRYIDGSFKQLILPGLNADALGRPLRWSFAGETGGGASDHFPVYARFSRGTGRAGVFFELDHPSKGNDGLNFEMPLAYQPEMELQLLDGAFLGGVDDADLGPYIGRLYRVEGRVLNLRPLTIEVGGVAWPAYAPDKKVAAQLSDLKGGVDYALLVTLTLWQKKREFIIEGIL
jgi:endonuclease/exonuclease/phosphatase family metal-dependent hydrolase